MSPIIESLSHLLSYNVPTILVIAGLVLFFLPYFKVIQPEQKKSLRVYGFVFFTIGIVLALIIKPPEPQQQLVPVYIVPAIASSGVNTEAIATISVPTASISSSGVNTGITATISVPTIPVLHQATNTPEPVTSVIPVWAIEENGVQVNISTSGVYKVAYLGDAYSPWPNEQYEGYQGWTTIIRIYINRAVEWGKTDYGLIGPVNQDDYLGPGGYFLDKNQAITRSTGDSRTFRLSGGDYLILVPLDEKGRYSDNKGKVDIGITYLGQ